MKFRGTDAEAEKIEPQMAPMIDIVFQLLIFFMLTLKIIEPEGDFSINMPIGAPSTTNNPDVNTVPLDVYMMASKGGDGSLASLSLGRQRGFAIRPVANPTRIDQWIEAHPEEGLDKNNPAHRTTAGVRLGEDDAFSALNSAIGAQVKSTQGSKQELEVTIHAAYRLHFRYTVKAISACRGKIRKGPDGEPKLEPYIANIKFAPAKPE